MSELPSGIIDRATACMWGAATGDAVGKRTVNESWCRSVERLNPHDLVPIAHRLAAFRRDHV